MSQKNIKVITSIISAIYIIMLFTVKCFYYYHYNVVGKMYSSGRNTSYYGALEEYIWWIVILIVVEVVLLWTKYYYASPVAGIIALAFMIVGVISTSNISNVEIYDELLLTLDFIPISLCIVGDFWLIVKCRAEKTVLTKNETTSSAQAIKEYKELLDQGIISQEEYDKKKKQLLER